MKRVTLMVLALAAVLSCLADEVKTLEIGQSGPDFKLSGIDGKVYSLASFKEARLLTIIFTANHCPTAQAYEERMKQLSADFSPEQMQLVAISSNHPGAVCLEELGYTDLGDTFEEMKIRAAEAAYNFPYLYDGEDQTVALAYGAVATPHVFILDQDRKLRYRGRIDEMEDPYQTPTHHDARNAIEALLANRPVPVESTRAFGCSMKWKSKLDWRKKLDSDWASKAVEVKPIGEEAVRELLKNSGDKIRLINIWATWCGPCVIEFPELVDTHRMYEGRDFEVITISLDRPTQEERVLKFLKGKQAAFTNYLYQPSDKEGLFESIDPDWQGNIPYTLIVLPGGKVIYRHSGIIDPLEVRKTIVGQLGRYFADDK